MALHGWPGWQAAIDRGLTFLSADQQPDGNFATFLSTHTANWQAVERVPTVFTAALLLGHLQPLKEHPGAAECQRKIAAFLLTQKSEHWTFNYWTRDSRESRERPYPDDLDDTCCVLAALTEYDPALITGEVLAHIITVLTAVEEQEGGPYRTWLVPATADQAWRDVDLVVNSNVHYFLALHEVELPQLTALIEQAIEAETYRSPYYPWPYVVTYFIARGYRGAQRAKLKTFLLEHRHADGTWGAPLATALAATALMRLGVSEIEIERGIVTLVAQQEATGAWPAGALWLDRTAEGSAYFAGSTALTTGFCLEALARYQQHYGSAADRQQVVRPLVVTAHYGRIWEVARARVLRLTGDLKTRALKLLDSMQNSQSQQLMVRIPELFTQAVGQRGLVVTAEQQLTVGVATLYGWLAYTIYDDFLDEEGELALLPLANVFLREASLLFAAEVGNDAQFMQLLRTIWDAMEAANTWEVLHCRGTSPLQLPDFGNFEPLAARSLGMSLGPLVVLHSLGISAQHTDVQQVVTFFRHFLIARQLLDDAHDWEEDLRRGQINAAGALVLREYQRQHGRLTQVPTDVLALQALFWEVVIHELFTVVLEQLEQAESALTQITCVRHPKHMAALLEPLKQTAQATLQEQSRVTSFLKVYANIDKGSSVD